MTAPLLGCAFDRFQVLTPAATSLATVHLSSNHPQKTAAPPWATTSTSVPMPVVRCPHTNHHPEVAAVGPQATLLMGTPMSIVHLVPPSPSPTRQGYIISDHLAVRTAMPTMRSRLVHHRITQGRMTVRTLPTRPGQTVFLLQKETSLQLALATCTTKEVTENTVMQRRTCPVLVSFFGTTGT